MYNFIKSPILSLRVYDVVSPARKAVAVKGRPFHALSYRKEGTVTVGDRTSLPGSITLTPKGHGYTTEVLEETRMIAIHFDCAEELQPFVLQDAPSRMQQLFEKVLKTDGNRLECYACFYSLLAELEKLLREKRERKIPSAVVDAKEKIDENFSDPQFNIDELVARLPIGASYLRQEFRKAYGLTPIAYLCHMRQQKAVSLLSSGYHSVEELAGLCGYGSAGYFIQSFRKSTGYSPLKYKAKFL